MNREKRPDVKIYASMIRLFIVHISHDNNYVITDTWCILINSNTNLCRDQNVSTGKSKVSKM